VKPAMRTADEIRAKLEDAGDAYWAPGGDPSARSLGISDALEWVLGKVDQLVIMEDESES
jgi:hypothetical protein